MGEMRVINGHVIERQPDGTFLDHGPSGPPPNPDYQVKAATVPTQIQQAGADLRKTQAMTGEYGANADRAQASAAQTRALLPAETRRATAQATVAEREANAAKGNRPALGGQDFADALQAYYATQLLDKQIAEMEQKYNAGPGSTHGLAGLQDYLPTPSNQAFDKAAGAVRGPTIQALNFRATQMNTPKEAEMNIGAFIPNSKQYDSTITDTIARLKDLRQSTLQRVVSLLGGIPDQQGNIVPLSKIPREQWPHGLTDKPIGPMTKQNKSINFADLPG